MRKKLCRIYDDDGAASRWRADPFNPGGKGDRGTYREWGSEVYRSLPNFTEAYRDKPEVYREKPVVYREKPEAYRYTSSFSQ